MLIVSARCVILSVLALILIDSREASAGSSAVSCSSSYSNYFPLQVAGHPAHSINKCLIVKGCGQSCELLCVSTSAVAGAGSARAVANACSSFCKPCPIVLPTSTPTPVVTVVPKACDSLDISAQQHIVDASVFTQKGLVSKAASKLTKVMPSSRSFAKSMKSAANELYLSSWQTIYSEPNVSVQCQGIRADCATVSSTLVKALVAADSAAFSRLLINIRTRLTSKKTAARNFVDNLLQESIALEKIVTAELSKIPNSRSQCLK